MIDFHTHILPKMDDGASSITESLEMLQELENQDVKLVCLTPHFYSSEESIDEFLLRRKKAFDSLNYSGNLILRLGAEVRYYRGISENEELTKLCLENTNLLLLELPFNMNINENILRDVININRRGIKVVLAHIERYSLSLDMIRYIKSNGILIQANNEYIIGSLFDNKGIKLLKQGYIDLLGSDAHNQTNRKVNTTQAYNKIKKQIGEEFIDFFINNNLKIIS